MLFFRFTFIDRTKYISYRRGSIKTPKYVKEKELKPLTLSKKISLSHMLKSFKRSLK